MRDEEDDEVKKYTYDKNIVEVLVDKENTSQVMEIHLLKLMDHCLKYLKQMRLINPQTHPKFVNKMTVLNLQDDIRSRV